MQDEPKVDKTGIVDAVKDQDDLCWIAYGTAEKFVWFSLAEMHEGAASVYRRLSTAGVNILTNKAKETFKAALEKDRVYRGALVASRPGWLGNHYVLGDGTVVSPEADQSKVLIAFEGDRKFSGVGTLPDWQVKIGPLVVGQSIPLFALSLAFVGPIMRFVPPDYVNALAEIVGPHGCGKSTVGVLASSVWAGNPRRDCGGGESWDLTINAIDALKVRHADGFLSLDEGNLTGSTEQKRGEVVSQAVFKLAGTGQKLRHGDKGSAMPASLALMSTTNDALRSLVKGSADAQGALESRMITVEVSGDRPFGVLDSIPTGFASSQLAIECLRRCADESYGVAGPAFVRKLQRAAQLDEAALRAKIQKGLEDFLRLLPSNGPQSPRLRKTFALVAVAGALSQKSMVTPAAWGPLPEAVRKVYGGLYKSAGTQALSAVERIKAYTNDHENDLVQAEDLAEPLAFEAFQRACGFRLNRNGQKFILIPTPVFQQAFGNDAIPMMRELRRSGLAKTEGGNKPKLSDKPPNAVCKTGRAYWIDVTAN